MLASCSRSATINRWSGLFISNPKEPVAGIAQAGENVAFIVQCLVNGGSKDRQLRIASVTPANAFGRGDEVHHSHMLHSQLYQQIHGSDGAASGGQHWVNQDDLKRGQ